MEACVVFCCTHKPPERQGKVLVVNGVEEYAREQAQSFLSPENITELLKAFRDEPSRASSALVPIDEVLADNANLAVHRWAPLGSAPAANGVPLRETVSRWSDALLALRRDLAEWLDSGPEGVA
jgi:type I restriction enzyme M protein